MLRSADFGFIGTLTLEDSSFAERGNEPSGQTPPPSLPAEPKCIYCGRVLEQQSATCPGCGTLRVPPVIESAITAPIKTPVLNAGNATLILVAFLVGQFCLAAMVGFVYGFQQAVSGATSRGNRHLEMGPSFMAPAMLLGFIGGGIGMIWLAQILIKPALRNRTEVGAAWVAGRGKDIGKGLLIGIAIAILYMIPASLVMKPPDEESLGPLTRMSTTPGFPQIAWFFMALFLAPPLEELLFRGVLYGGYRKSLGPAWAAWLTTGIFALLHITEAFQHPTALIAIACMALVALRVRLRSSAIGPAIAVHFGYNFVIALGVLGSTLLRDGK